MDRPGLPSIFLSTLALGKVPSRPSRACVDSENTLHVFHRHINCNRVHARESKEAERYGMLVVRGRMKTWLFMSTFCLECYKYVCFSTDTTIIFVMKDLKIIPIMKLMDSDQIHDLFTILTRTAR